MSQFKNKIYNENRKENRKIYNKGPNDDKSLLEKIRSRYILKKLFENLKEKKCFNLLNIIKLYKIN